MGKQLALIGSAIGAAVLVATYLLVVPLQRRLPRPGRVAIDGITTIADAVAACRQSHLQGWELVAYVQQVVARKFTYSRLNTWDTPDRAFERGLGYCEQQALALKHIYDQLDIPARGVFALRCKFPPKVVDGMPWAGGISGHAWLRVTIGDEERDVCSGSVNNTPGVTHFEVLSPIHVWQPWLRPFTHLGSSLANIQRDHAARQALKQEALTITARKLTTKSLVSTLPRNTGESH